MHIEYDTMECPQCKTAYGYVKIKTKQWYCRKCNTLTNLDKVDDKQGICIVPKTNQGG